MRTSLIEQLIATIEGVIPDPQVDADYVDPQVVAQAVWALLAEQPTCEYSDMGDGGYFNYGEKSGALSSGRYALVRLP